MDTQPIVTCPICLAHLDAIRVPDHWVTHVCAVPQGSPQGEGQYTWVCECGPTAMTWVDEGSAAAGLAIHMQLRHNIAM
jgi:hypothetical protein